MIQATYNNIIVNIYNNHIHQLNGNIIKKLHTNPFRIIGDTVYLYDVNGIEIKVSIEDYDKIKGYTWYSCKDNDGYVITRIGKGNTLYLHRFIMNVKDTVQQVDHRDLDVLNNKRDNLHIVNNRKNNRNKAIHQVSRNNTYCIREYNGYKTLILNIKGKKYHILNSNDNDILIKARDIADKIIEETGTLTKTDINNIKIKVGIKDTNSETEAYSNNLLGLKGIRKVRNRYEVRLNFKDGNGMTYIGSSKDLNEAINIRDKALRERNKTL